MTIKTEGIQVRILKYILGLFIMTLGVSVAIKSNLGAAPVSTVPYSITLISGLEMGLATMAFQSFLVVL